MLNKRYVIMAGLSAGLMMFGGQASGFNVPGEFCKYDLTPADPESMAEVTIVRESERSVLNVLIFDADDDTLYTVWVDFRNRARLKLTGISFEALSDDYKPLVAKGALERGVAPAFASTAGVTAGMGIDRNGVITNSHGDAELEVVLDYNLLQPGNTPVVGGELAMQGLNRVGGYWLRVYLVDPTVSASLQVTGEDDLPLLERATAQGITIVRHPDFITHGHTPGVKNVDHFSGFKGDFPEDCLPSLQENI